jgi:DNA primase
MTAAPARRYDVEALRHDHPVERVAAGYGVALRPSGRALVGRCPLPGHDDREHPNLYVYPGSASWFCYRCAVGGDVIELVRRREFDHLPEGAGFLAACARLAGGPPAPVADTPGAAPGPRPDRTERRWDRLTLDEQVVMNTACAVYQRALWREPAALAYLRGRAIPDWVIRACGLGYADGHSLEAYLRPRAGLRTAQDLGLLRRAARGDAGRPLREFLAGRIVVPELRSGQCVWLIGRAVDGAGDGAPAGHARGGPRRLKYLALGGERPVLGLERAAGRRVAFLCEGVVDYLTAVAWRLPAFSPCGTALPAERLGFLAGARVVFGVLDGDAAGLAAAERFGAQLGGRFRPVRLPDGADLNDLAQRPGGRTVFFRLVTAARWGAPQPPGETGAPPPSAWRAAAPGGAAAGSGDAWAAPDRRERASGDPYAPGTDRRSAPQRPGSTMPPGPPPAAPARLQTPAAAAAGGPPEPAQRPRAGSTRIAGRPAGRPAAPAGSAEGGSPVAAATAGTAGTPGTRAAEGRADGSEARRALDG